MISAELPEKDVYAVTITHPKFGTKNKECETSQEAVDYVTDILNQYFDAEYVIQKIHIRRQNRIQRMKGE